MPCPLFLPGAPLPLTEIHSGVCAAEPGAMIPLDTLRECCNRGYARGSCERARSVEPDATSFMIRSDRDGVIEVAWALERDHHPIAVGRISFSEETPPSAEPLEHQARSCVSAYLRASGRALQSW
ncbi:MAG TPA: hypothetical protein VHB50_20150 [Bryobacteraceae bacterium]|nr:hypothetical protein [Bryobacteraceae bacterium]